MQFRSQNCVVFFFKLCFMFFLSLYVYNVIVSLYQILYYFVITLTITSLLIVEYRNRIQILGKISYEIDNLSYMDEHDIVKFEQKMNLLEDMVFNLLQ